MPCSDYSLDDLVLTVECAATNQRAAAERREELSSRRRWNPALMPAEWRFADELAAAAVKFRELAEAEKARLAQSPSLGGQSA